MESENVPNGPNGDFEMPSIESILKALETMDDISEEDKIKLRENLLARQESGEGALFEPIKENLAEAVQTASASNFLDVVILLTLISLVLLVLVFFGYKLYKSLAEREKRKEEKRRQKQQKKKK